MKFHAKGEHDDIHGWEKTKTPDHVSVVNLEE